ncbi:hypothetical protein ACI7BZ_00815 [Xanthobacter sp. AM11]|uniref:hypothetical protein n=1 Tax=Xanthobacter sp. AM11 TaxID=3380643 RepID=UPI0039BF2F00
MVPIRFEKLIHQIKALWFELVATDGFHLSRSNPLGPAATNAATGAWHRIQALCAFSLWLDRQKSQFERFFTRIEQMRGLATCYDRRPDNFLAALKLAATRIWINAL